jgi:hypothetical protein
VKSKKIIIINIIKLLSGGVLTSIGLIIIASQRWSFLERSESLFFIKYYQWELFGLTVSKLGLDQVNYAFVIENKNEQLDIKYYTIRNSFLTLLFCLLSYYFTSLPSIALCIVMFFTIVLDLYSILSLSTFNALSKFNIILVSNILNYPLFFIILNILSYFLKDLGSLTISMIFLISSFIRALYLFFKTEKELHLFFKKKIFIQYNLLGFQQILNYILFKTDQILISLLNGNNNLLSISNEVQTYILFYARIPEIYSSVSTGLSTLYIEKYSNFVLYKKKYNKNIIIISICIFIILGIASFYIYSKLLDTNIFYEDHILYWIAYSLQLLLIIPANVLTFSLIRKNLFKHLNMALIISISLTTLIVIFSVITFNNFEKIIKYIVPVQLFVFIVTILIIISYKLNNNTKGK